MSTVPSSSAGTDPTPTVPSPARPGGASRQLSAGSFRSRALDIGMVIVLVVLGVAEGWTRYPLLASDAISYLDISRAIPSLDWKLIFNPFWGLGYPVLLAIARPLFPATPRGEWNMIHVVNLVILLVAWAAFLFLLRSLPLADLQAPPQEVHRRQVFLKAVAFAVFLALALCMNGVSSIEPDLLVACVFLFAMGLMIWLVRAPGLWRAAALGCVLGLGYWVKNVGLPLALIVLATALAALCWNRRSAIKPILIAFLIFLLVAAPYVVGLSRSYGSFTLGLSGSLNYAFHVNRLPHWTNWQGGPLPVYGTPVHPTSQVMSNPDVFVFGEPFPATYPPFSHIAYWYKGFRTFFNPKLQTIAILRSGYAFLKILFGQPILYASLAALLLLAMGLRNAEDRKNWLRRLLRLWPVYVPAIVAIAMYLLVHVQSRYISSFFAILYIVPFAALAGGRLPARKVLTGALAVLVAGVILNLAVIDRASFENVAHRKYYTNNSGWLLAKYLRAAGMKPGEKVAAVGGPNAFCEWAYLDHLRIVAEMGGDPYDQWHPEKTSPQAVAAEMREFWRNPGVQGKVLEQFRRAGAVAVIAPAKPAGLSLAGWVPAPGAHVWVYQFSNVRLDASGAR